MASNNLPRSPLAPESFPDMPAVPGVEIAGEAVGLKPSGDRDLFFATLPPGATVAGTLTKSLCASAPVDWCRKCLPDGKVRAIVVNSGNANAFTGNAGDRVVSNTVAGVSSLLGCAESEVLVASTGVIGVPVPDDHIAKHLPTLNERLTPTAWPDAAAAIRTTDTFSKAAATTVTIDDVPVRVAGIAKGSGMIAPDMATMLAFIFTDARLPAPVLDRLLKSAVDQSFNCITVDGDTSTSDTVLLAASGVAEHGPIEDHRDRRLSRFRRALNHVASDLAQQIVRDGEGARKFVSITVTGAASARAARKVGLTIANSPLVKTAIAGEDANWGRVVMAVGKAGERADRDRLSIAFGGIAITRNGQIVPNYDETPVAAHMKGDHIEIMVDLGIGRGRATVWTCDLTEGYIKINADYRS